MLGVRSKLRELYSRFFYNYILPYFTRKITEKPQINVGFVLTELDVWKTESLFLAMRNHYRFKPIIIVVTSAEIANSKYKVIQYCEKKGYEYVHIQDNERIDCKKHFDILFYQKPYSECYLPIHRWNHYRSSALCWVKYGFHLIDEYYTYNSGFQNFAWKLFYENELCLASARKMQKNHAINCYVTGVPMTDELMTPKEMFDDPWKKINRQKRIIYAPHHTIGKENNKLVKNLVNYGTFLEFGEFMLEMAIKYKDSLQFAFKPHPLLKVKLRKFWSDDKIEKYYSAWEKLENCQYVDGKYDDLFKYSDAMIHDCSSFTVEYHYTKNPVMYLVKDENHANNLNAFGKKAYELHYQGKTKDDIEKFLLDIINSIDVLKEKREAFYEEFLIPPYGNKSCENIINCILEEKEYSGKS